MVVEKAVQESGPCQNEKFEGICVKCGAKLIYAGKRMQRLIIWIENVTSAVFYQHERFTA